MQKSRDHQTLLYALTQQGCPLCRLVQERLHRYLDSWKYELFTDRGVREQLRNSQGFCHEHTWQLARMGASFPLALAYRDVITDTIEQLQSESQRGNLHRFRRLFESKPGQNDCPACLQRSKTEENYIHSLRQALLEPEFSQQFAASDGLCLDHFRMVCELRLTDISGDWLSILRQVQLTCLRRLDHDLGELIRKHDYRFKDEPRGPEMQSWRRAAGLVAGEETST